MLRSEKIEMSENMIVFAARYAHARSTGAPLMVVKYILRVWDSLSDRTKETLYDESFDASFCKEDWKMLQDRFEGKVL